MALTDIRKVEMIKEPDPVLLEESDVMISVSHMGVCGSDMHQYTTGGIGGHSVEYPFVLGHEGSGVIEDFAAGVKGLKKGQRIAIEPAMPCLKCDQCLAGRQHTCHNMVFLGSPGQAPGLLCETIVMPAHCCYPLPDHLGNELAVLAEPLSIAIWSADLAGIIQGKSIGILGSGPIGMSVLLYCRYLGAEKIYITDKLDYKLKMAEDAGALWTGNPDSSDIVAGILEKESGGLDLVFDCCGMQEAMDQAISLLKPGGKIIIVGIPEFDSWSLSADLIRRKEICFQNVRRQNDRMQTALDLISQGELDMSPLITHRFSFQEAAKAFDIVSKYQDAVMKAIIVL